MTYSSILYLICENPTKLDAEHKWGIAQLHVTVFVYQVANGSSISTKD